MLCVDGGPQCARWLMLDVEVLSAKVWLTRCGCSSVEARPLPNDFACKARSSRQCCLECSGRLDHALPNCFVALSAAEPCATANVLLKTVVSSKCRLIFEASLVVGRPRRARAARVHRRKMRYVYMTIAIAMLHAIVLQC